MLADVAQTLTIKTITGTRYLFNRFGFRRPGGGSSSQSAVTLKGFYVSTAVNHLLWSHDNLEPGLRLIFILSIMAGKTISLETN